jgi:hypothetical protein
MTERTGTTRGLVVSFHDLHPGTRDTCAAFLRDLAGLGVGRCTLLVVPCWHDGPSIARDPGFCSWLRRCTRAGHEICLHGFSHRDDAAPGSPWQRIVGRCYTAGEGEFYRIRHAEAARLLAAGRAMLETVSGLSVEGFTPPAWLLSPQGRDALCSAGFAYTTRWSGIDRLESGAFVHAPVLAWSSRSAPRRLASRAWVRLWGACNRAVPVLRIAVHPRDLTHATVRASVERALCRALADGRQPLTYRDLVSRDPVAAVAAG